MKNMLQCSVKSYRRNEKRVFEESKNNQIQYKTELKHYQNLKTKFRWLRFQSNLKVILGVNSTLRKMCHDFIRESWKSQEFKTFRKESKSSKELYRVKNDKLLLAWEIIWLMTTEGFPQTWIQVKTWWRIVILQRSTLN